MTHRATRAFLLLIVFAAVAGGGYLVWKLDARESAIREGAATLEKAAEHTLLQVERFRAAQQSYVADGQGSEFWMTRVTELLDDLDRTITTIAQAGDGSELRDAATSLTRTVEDLRKMDARAREWVRTGQPLMASDLIFTESLTTSSVVIGGITTIRDRDRQLTATALANVRRDQVLVLGSACAVCLIVCLLLVPGVRESTPQDTREALRALIEGTPTAVRADPASRPQSAANVTTPSSSGTTVPPVAAPTALDPDPAPAASSDAGATTASALSVDIPAAARLCSDLARILDPADLPGLLERCARLLDASGLIVWVADRAGRALFPMFAHGYSPAALSRMRGIHRDDENATALCYRLAEDRIVPARSGEPGAIVTPIVTPVGCVGVLAAEVSEGIEADADRRALAGILAAQLATFVTALPTPNEALQAQA